MKDYRSNQLSKTGLSLSQAQAVSNLCHQRADEIDSKFSSVNNYSKVVVVGGDPKTIQTGVVMPSNAIELLTEKAEYHALQAFLMENIKAKGYWLETLKFSVPNNELVRPIKPTKVMPEILSEVDEVWGWNQLTSSEIVEFTQVEAMAAHYGQFIHKGSILSKLRIELPNIPSIDWMELKKDEKTPIDITVHHTSNKLMKLHEEVAGLHRASEQRVNYFKAKVKNLVTLENAARNKDNGIRIAAADKVNSDASEVFMEEMRKYNKNLEVFATEFEVARQEKIGYVSALRIKIPERFKKTVDVLVNILA